MRMIAQPVWFLILIAGTAAAAQLDSDQLEESIGYVNNLQRSDGGFRPMSDEMESDLGATSSALRALHYLHPKARPRNRDGAHQYVMSCYSSESGSFAAKPGGRADVRSTAMGLMAVVELKLPADRFRPVSNYFAENAKSLPDIYIAAAALHAAQMPSAKAAEWIKAYEATRNPDGSYGKDATQDAGAIITFLRLGAPVQDPDAAAERLRNAQRDDGGFAPTTDAPADLSATYRIMRALYMLKKIPNPDGVRKFIQKCRNDDGGYGMKPGEPSTLSATYFAAVVTHWLDASR